MKPVLRFVDDVNNFERNEIKVVVLSMMAGEAAISGAFNGLQVPAAAIHAETGEAHHTTVQSLPFGLEAGGGALAGFLLATSLIRHHKHSRS